MTRLVLRLLPYSCLSILALAGCAKTATKETETPKTTEVTSEAVKPGEEAKLFPVKEGNKWVYETQTSTQYGSQGANKMADFTFTIGKVFPQADGSTDFELLITSSEEVNGVSITEKQIWSLGKTGLAVKSARIQPNAQSKDLAMVPFNPAQRMASFPMTEGKALNWDQVGPLPAGGGGDKTPVGRSQIQLTYVGAQQTDTLDKTYTAHVFEQEQRWDIPGFDMAKYNAALEKQRNPAGLSSKKPSDTLPKDPEQQKMLAELEPKVGKGISVMTTYFSPNVGLVRLRQEIAINSVTIVQIYKLKKFELK